MLETFICVILAYIIGCIVTYGRLYASMTYAYNKGLTKVQMTRSNALTDPNFRLIILSSWAGFAAGVSVYFEDEGEKQFFKF